MRHHPISPVTEPMQYRAIGVVRGRYCPDDPGELTRGHISTEDGSQLEAVVLGRVLTLMRRHIDLDAPHLWVTYPRCRTADQLHLQIVGIWEPSTLTTDEDSEEVTDTSDTLPEGDNYFSIRGEVLFTRPETGDVVLKVRQKRRADGQRPLPFKLQLKGTLPMDHLRQFVALDVRRHGQELQIEQHELVGPLPRRGERGGRARNKPARAPQRHDAAGGQPEQNRPASRPLRALRSALSRPGSQRG
ncbi:hypothetical protein [Synechococcus sp. RSCCF101]|uniref:hypothetical protein n=1 Tax=Synechococcus sp. RSCCF101 TaxID=2511069 RepID=UPI001CD99FAB|nr:hypothetical protein [Synechococcus sp. RSCCF101]